MLCVLGLSAWLLAGEAGVYWVLLAGATAMLLMPHLAGRRALGWMGARPIEPDDLAVVYRALDRLSAAAGLPAAPRLYFLAEDGLNAFAVGRRDDAAIVLTGGMFARLSLRELVAVLAHEVAHIANNDLWVMQLADTVSRLTRLMAAAGIAVAVVALPLTLLGAATVPVLAVLLLVLAPSAAALLQLSLSRTREFDADRRAAVLTGDPATLAAALTKIDPVLPPFWRRLLPGSGGPPSILRSHPPTVERIERLRDLVQDPVRDMALERRSVVLPEFYRLPPGGRGWRWRL